MKTLRRCVKGGLFLVLSLAILMCGAKIPAQTVGSDAVSVVTIQATEPIASGSGNPGMFTVFRQGNTIDTMLFPMEVFYQISGTASNGVDYASISNWVVFPEGWSASSITISPINSGLTNIQTVVLKLIPPPPQWGGLNYIIGSPSNATIFIESTNAPPFSPVSIGSPTNGAVFYTPTNIQISAWVFPLATNVEFFAGTNDLGEGLALASAGLLGTIYQLTWTNPAPADYPLTVIATGSEGIYSNNNSVASAPVNITVQAGPPPTNLPPVVRIVIPTDGAVFWAPTNISIGAIAFDLNSSMASIQFFAGTNSLGLGFPMAVPQFVCSNCPPFPFPNFGQIWTNPPLGDYALTAVVTDEDGASSTSAPVNITVLLGPPPNLPPTVNIIEPKDGDIFYTPTNVQIVAKASDPDGSVTNVEFFAGTNDLGAGTPLVLDPPGVNGVTGFVYSIYWRNPSLGNYVLTAVATDDGGLSATSAAVNVTIQPSPPPPTNFPPLFRIKIISPANGAVFRAPINLPLFAFFTYSYAPGDYASVGFYDGTNFLGLAQPVSRPTPLPLTPGGPTPGPVPPTALSTNIYELVWTNAPVGNHALTAEAGGGNLFNNAVWRIVSTPVNITILPSPPPPPTNRPAIVSIVATDPVAIEGTNLWVWAGETNSPPTWAAWPTVVRQFFTNSGPKTATFAVRRFGDTNSNLTVSYDIGGTASNGVDYVDLPGFATIPASEHVALITVVPTDDGPPDVNKTVILTLTSSTNTPPDYLLGFPRRAAALIIDSDVPRPLTGVLPDGSFHLVAPGPDAAWFCIQYSTNLTDWTPVCTNQVINGSIDFIDPDANGNPSRFYRAVPLANPPSN